ncbi:MAG: [FeFe] hydrogenase H-cluster maturation GTPase HydF [Selenomonadaceae bacterium]|nr:[FeFe] hydrogenase H-cluster maturation GTPase HydF [Selenomonadaceae bacterium]
MTTLQDTPRASRLHIGLFGRRNSGKSSLLNALIGQSLAVVSEKPGTTTDPVYKSMEIAGIGPVVFIDTAGFDDDEQEAGLGAARVRQTERAAAETDIALVLFSPEGTEDGDAEELAWVRRFQQTGKPVLAVIAQADVAKDEGHARKEAISRATGCIALAVSAKEKSGLEALRREIARLLPEDYQLRSITGDLVGEDTGDLVLLVMPQDIQAPKGRLILPQVQTLRELLDKHALVMSCTTDCLDAALAAMAKPPKLIITDSQAFRTVFQKKPAASKLTSFSALFAALKGDIDYFLEGAHYLADLASDAKADAAKAGSAAPASGEPLHVLIAEACTHKPLDGDIGRIKIPRLLKKAFGEDGVQTLTVSGKDFPDDLTPYDLIIHCGSCMFNRSYVLYRAREAKAAHVPMTNYGLAIAAMLGILDDISLPENPFSAR